MSRGLPPCPLPCVRERRGNEWSLRHEHEGPLWLARRAWPKRPRGSKLKNHSLSVSEWSGRLESAPNRVVPRVESYAISLARCAYFACIDSLLRCEINGSWASVPRSRVEAICRSLSRSFCKSCSNGLASVEEGMSVPHSSRSIRASMNHSTKRTRTTLAYARNFLARACANAIGPSEQSASSRGRSIPAGPARSESGKWLFCRR